VEREYAKLEPYLNIYTSKIVKSEGDDRKELDRMRQQLSSLTSQVNLLTSMLSLKGIPVPSEKTRKIEKEVLKKLPKEYILDE
jgi:hypothetical protein